jgi:hypothetical protein
MSSSLVRPSLLVLALTVASGVLPAQVQVITGTPQVRFAESYTRIASVRELEGDTLMLLVHEQGERRIDRVDLRRGTRVQVGRNGAGPREYNAPSRLYAGAGGSTLFMDAGSRRGYRIARDGTTLSDLTIPPDAIGTSATLLGTDAAGGMVLRAVGADGLDADSAAVIRFDPITGRVEILAHIASGFTINRTPGGVTFGRAGFRPYEAVPVFGVLPAGELIELSPEPYRVRRLVNGNWVAGPNIPHVPVPVTAADRDQEREIRRRAQPTGFGGAPAQRPPEEDLSDAVFPKVKPPYAGTAPMMVAPNGEVWITRSRPFGEAAITYDVLGPNGARLREVKLPPHRRLVGFGRNALYLVWQDPETDLQYVERWGVQ